MLWICLPVINQTLINKLLRLKRKCFLLMQIVSSFNEPAKNKVLRRSQPEFLIVETRIVVVSCFVKFSEAID